MISYTGKLRFIYRPKSAPHPTLQQQIRKPFVYTNTHGEEELAYEYEWVDVPILLQDPGPNAE